MQVFEIKNLVNTINNSYDYENVYVYINGKKVNIQNIDSRTDNGYIEISIEHEGIIEE